MGSTLFLLANSENMKVGNWVSDSACCRGIWMMKSSAVSMIGIGRRYPHDVVVQLDVLLNPPSANETSNSCRFDSLSDVIRRDSRHLFMFRFRLWFVNSPHDDVRCSNSSWLNCIRRTTSREIAFPMHFSSHLLLGVIPRRNAARLVCFVGGRKECQTQAVSMSSSELPDFVNNSNLFTLINGLTSAWIYHFVSHSIHRSISCEFGWNFDFGVCCLPAIYCNSESFVINMSIERWIWGRR